MFVRVSMRAFSCVCVRVRACVCVRVHACVCVTNRWVHERRATAHY